MPRKIHYLNARITPVEYGPNLICIRVTVETDMTQYSAEKIIREDALESTFDLLFDSLKRSVKDTIKKNEPSAVTEDVLT